MFRAVVSQDLYNTIVISEIFDNLKKSYRDFEERNLAYVVG